MKNSLKIFSFILVANAIAGCATAQKTAKIEMEAMPTTIHHSDESAEGHYKRGRYLQGAQRSDQALQAYQEALKLEPNDIKVHIAVAALYAERGEYATSISQLKGLTEKLPDDASLHNNLGYTYYLSGDYKAATTAFGKAIIIDPTNVHALNNMGAALNKLGKTDHAIKYIALAKTIKTGKIRPAKEPLVASNTVKPISETNQQTLDNQALAKEPAIVQNQISGEIAMEKTSQTEIKQLSSGIYEIVMAETRAESANTNAPAQPLSEIKVLAQSGGITFKAHPLVNKLFNDNAFAIANNGELGNKMFTLEIVNGNGVKNFAKKTKETLIEIGLNQPQQIADKKRYNQYKTILQYRVGYLDEALKLGKTLSKMPALVELNTMPSNADLRLVLGKDVVNLNYKFS
jgi:tetratricopeptide (TPR) repeat protein